MKKLYLVCTHSAISASALTYMINQSPDFYNVTHNNLWLSETGDFGHAATINDWWNIPDNFLKYYNKSIRNAKVLSVDVVQELVNKFNESTINKNLAIFTHAENSSELSTFLPKGSVIQTTMGRNFYPYVQLWLKREYNNIMNKFIDADNAWTKLGARYIEDMHENSDAILINVDTWLKGNPFSHLGIKENESAFTWRSEYLTKNNFTDVNTFIEDNSILARLTSHMMILEKVLYTSGKLAAVKFMHMTKSQHPAKACELLGIPA